MARRTKWVLLVVGVLLATGGVLGGVAISQEQSPGDVSIVGPEVDTKQEEVAAAESAIAQLRSQVSTVEQILNNDPQDPRREHYEEILARFKAAIETYEAFVAANE
jgi:hypothetical protein